MYAITQNAISACCVACSLYAAVVIGSLFNFAKGDAAVEDLDSSVIPHASTHVVRRVCDRALLPRGVSQ